MSTEAGLLVFISGAWLIFEVVGFYRGLSLSSMALFWTTLGFVGWLSYRVYQAFFSKKAKEERVRIMAVRELPPKLLVSSMESVRMGMEQDLKIPIFLPDSIRLRHIHVLGATGSGKTESVILNFLKQDVERGFGSIILDAKGDLSFVKELKDWVPEDRLRVFDLSSEKSLSYDPVADGYPLEAAQRLFSSLVWSEEYYKSKALSALQRLFQKHRKTNGRNPKLSELLLYLDNQSLFVNVTRSEQYSDKLAEKDFQELSGLRDQVRSLCIGHLEKILSPPDESAMQLQEAAAGKVLYFRLQSLLSPQVVSTLGKLVINHLSYLAGTAHRGEKTKAVPLVPVYFDEFASFACPEFSDLISKARSAGFALHFSHQSIGDLAEVSKGFLSQITDNSATKIVLRINDPDTAEFFSRSFGTKLYQKVTQRITNAKDLNQAEIVGEGTTREAHQFRAPPDLFKTLPTGSGAVLMAHGEPTPHGASSVFRLQFPRFGSETKIPLVSAGCRS